MRTSRFSEEQIVKILRRANHVQCQEYRHGLPGSINRVSTSSRCSQLRTAIAVNSAPIVGLEVLRRPMHQEQISQCLEERLT